MLRRLLLAIAFVLSLVPSTALQTVAQDPGTGKTVNLEIIVDSSGSMAALTDTGMVRMDSAKAVLSQVISQLPVADNINVGLRVYGHRGDNTDAGRPESCVSSDLLVPMDGVNPELLTQQVNALQPVGWTPIGYSLQQAANDFTQPAGDNVVNAIVMVTDGLETCDADPVAIAGELRASEKGIVTHVIGFGTTPEEQAILSGIAESGGGQLFSSNNAGQLMSALFEVLEELEVVEETGSGEARNSPLGVGRIGRVGDYDVSVLNVVPSDPNAFSASAFGEPAPPGQQFFVVRIAVTYVGDATGTPSSDLNFQAVGTRSVSYSGGANLCGTGDLSSSVFLATELFPGGSAEYDLCWQIDSADAGSLVMYVEPWLDFNANPVWFSLGNPIEVVVDPNASPTTAPAVPTPTPTQVAAPSESVTTAQDTSRTNPVPVGQSGRVGDYEIVVVNLTPNHPEAFSGLAYGQPAPPGEQFFVARVAVTYVGTGTGTPSGELNFQAVGASNVGYSAAMNLCGTGTLSESVALAPEMFPGGTGEYEVCWQIDNADADSLVMYVEPYVAPNAAPTWFSLGNAPAPAQ